ncbi:MAG TPA: hypothetical protein DCR46_00015 [Cytophagales bacterium]|nr:hypothetical protein [Cytophagales bacterium]
MKVSISTTLIFLLFSTAIQAQETRFFQFKTTCGHGNWQDTSFIASASDKALIDTVLANLARPIKQRNFISGNIKPGDGGHNRNGSHTFLWHFVPNQWNLAEMAIELCDGCPYSDVDADTAYWIGTVKRFCPWSGIPVKEVLNPALGIESSKWQNEVSIHPNPAQKNLKVHWNGASFVLVTIHNSVGQKIMTYELSGTKDNIDLPNLESGMYFLEITDLKNTTTKKLLVERK